MFYTAAYVMYSLFSVFQCPILVIMIALWFIFQFTDYDAIALSPGVGVPETFDQTKFDAHDDMILCAALKLADKLKQVEIICLQSNCFQCLQRITRRKDPHQYNSIIV